MFIRILFIILTLSFCNIAGADTIVLKNGRRIEVEKAWEDGGQIKGLVYGATIGYPKDQVKNIVREKKFKMMRRKCLDLISGPWGWILTT